MAGRRGEENIDGMLGTALTAFFYGPLGHLIARRLSTYLLALVPFSAFCKCKTPQTNCGYPVLRLGLESQKRPESSGLLIVIGWIKEIGAVEGVWSEDRIEMDYHHGPRRWSCNHSESSLNAREPMKDI